MEIRLDTVVVFARSVSDREGGIVLEREETIVEVIRDDIDPEEAGRVVVVEGESLLIDLDGED